MNSLKFGLERPVFIWLLIVLVYGSIFWSVTRAEPFTEAERATISIVQKFSEADFPPRIGMLREFPDWGHVGFYALMGRLHHFVKGDVVKLRAANLVMLLAAMLVFVSLGYHFTYRNRLNPLWISLGLVLFAANPYTLDAGFRVDFMAPFLLLLLGAMYLSEKDNLGWAAIFTSLAVLVDWRALLLAVALVITRMTGERTKLVRAERLFSFVLPFAVAMLPLVVWHGPVPQGEAREWWNTFFSKFPVARPDGLFYSLVLFPIYTAYFTWSWGVRARARAMVIGAIWAAVAIPLFFLFPIHFDYWAEAHDGVQRTLGLIDQSAFRLVGGYKQFVLFVPFLAGVFLFAQMMLMDILDLSRWLRVFIVLFFAVQIFVIGVSDKEFLIVLPVILLFSLSEALVGEEGKIA